MIGRAGGLLRQRAWLQHLPLHRHLPLPLLLLLPLLLVLFSWTASTAQAGPVDAIPARPKQQFEAPAPGSYTLEVIQRAPDGQVLDSDGRLRALRDYTTGKITLLSFIYTYCVDPVGCPLAFQTFSELRRRLLAQPELAGQVRLVSLSFDPTHDVPQEMKLYAGPLADPRSPVRWHFLTTRSVPELKPILDDFGQDVSVTLDTRHQPTRVFNHLLKIFLIDAAGQVREIYTTAYLMPDVVFNDIQTLWLERGRSNRSSLGLRASLPAAVRR